MEMLSEAPPLRAQREVSTSSDAGREQDPRPVLVGLRAPHFLTMRVSPVAREESLGLACWPDGVSCNTPTMG